MGREKAVLDWGGAPLLLHVVEVVAQAAGGPIVVVKAAGQRLPTLPRNVEVVEDANPDRGPLEGLAAGLSAVAGRADRAFVSAVDVPFLAPEFVVRVLAGLSVGIEAAVPTAAGQSYPLSAGYAISALGVARDRLARGELRLRGLLDHLQTRLLDEAWLLADPALAAADPELRSLLNVNTPEDYGRAVELTP